MSQFSSYNPYAKVEALQTATYGWNNEWNDVVEQADDGSIVSVNITPPMLTRGTQPCSPNGNAFQSMKIAFGVSRTYANSVWAVPNPPYSNPFKNMDWVTNYDLQKSVKDM